MHAFISSLLDPLLIVYLLESFIYLALLSGRTNVFPAEASWSHEKAAEFNVDSHSFGRSVLMEQVTFESYNSAAISARPLPTIPPSGGSSRRNPGGGTRNDGLI